MIFEVLSCKELSLPVTTLVVQVPVYCSENEVDTVLRRREKLVSLTNNVCNFCMTFLKVIFLLQV